jgi:hypothetical protein
MRRVVDILKSSGSARACAAGKRRSRVHQPCLSPLEARTLLSSLVASLYNDRLDRDLKKRRAHSP